MIRRQLTDYVTASLTVLDIGCGQGTQLLELAVRSRTATGVEPSEELRELCSRAARQRQVNVKLLDGTVEDLDTIVGERRFDRSAVKAS